jgi:hypothetical protein
MAIAIACSVVLMVVVSTMMYLSYRDLKQNH